MNIENKIKNEFLLFDGAMGTMLQSNGLSTGELPEIFNITKPDIVQKIHREFVEAGSDIISTNTFGANRLKLENSGYSTENIIKSAIKNARAANPKYVALDIGPTGSLLEPMGPLSFEESYEIFKEQIIAGKDADLIIIETFSCIYEAKSAILAAKENSDLPIIFSMTYQEDGRTFIGSEPSTVVLTLQSLGISAIGVNCSLGPEKLIPIVDEILKYSKLPVIVQANAGLPSVVDSKTIYNVSATDFSKQIEPMIEKGVSILGGCCGTTPEYIANLKNLIKSKNLIKRNPITVTAVTSSSKTVFLDNKFTVIGERINPTGKKKLKAALSSGDMDYLVSEALAQIKADSDILDVNVGLPEIDEVATMIKAIKSLRIFATPLQIDSADPKVIEAGVRIYNGKPLINSVNGKEKSLKEILPIVKKYGATVIGLTLDDEGIPDTAEKRFQIAKKIMDTAISYGIPKEDIIIDTLTLTASAQQTQAEESLKAITLIKNALGLKCSLGVSNISFGLPKREIMNTAFLAMAVGAGLDTAILDPLSKNFMSIVKAIKVLKCQDMRAESYINFVDENSDINEEIKTNNTEKTLKDIINDGIKEEAADKVRKMLETLKPMDIVNKHIIPALDEIGLKFEEKKIFLPQLMQSAETVKQAFSVIKETMSHTDIESSHKGKILLATVKGDVHDIGKNIVKLLLENYGYKIYDLGKDVEISAVIEKVKNENIKLIGLSALMTTTVKSMEDTITALRCENLDCKVIVGGAVLNKEYADMVGADFYAKDAREGIKLAREFFNN